MYVSCLYYMVVTSERKRIGHAEFVKLEKGSRYGNRLVQKSMDPGYEWGHRIYGI